MAISGFNLKLDPEMVMLPQIPQIWGGSGNLMGQVFLENPTLFLEMVALFWVKMVALFLGQNGGPFWSQNGGTPGCPRVLLTPTTTISRTFYSLTSIFTPEKIPILTPERATILTPKRTPI